MKYTKLKLYQDILTMLIINCFYFFIYWTVKNAIDSMISINFKNFDLMLNDTYKFLIDNYNLPICITNLEGNITYSNKHFTELLDVEFEDILDRNFDDILSFYWRECYKERRHYHLKTEQASFGLIHLFAFDNDDTERLLDETVHNYHLPALIFDKEKRIIAYNKEAKLIIGKKRRYLDEIFYPEDVVRISEHIESFPTGVKFVEFSLQLLKKAKSFDSRIKLSQMYINEKRFFLITILEISLVKLRSDYYNAAISYIKTLWNKSSDAYRLTDSEGKIIAVNKVFCEMVKLDKKQIINKNLVEVYQFPDEKSKQDNIEIYKRSFDAKQFSEMKLISPTLKSGETLHVKRDYYFIQDFKKRDLLLTVFNDLTELHNVKARLNDIKDLADMGSMMAYISHEIKTPLASISLNLDMIKRSVELPPSKLKSINIINKEVRRLNNLLKNILTYSRQQFDLTYVTVNINEFVQSTCDIINPLLADKQVELQNLADNIIINADYKYLQTAIIQLIENSLDAIATDGIIKVYTSELDGWVNIFIEDNGEGVNEIEKIFNPFYTTKRYGTGLGLSIVQKIVDKHNGKFGLVESARGKTIFCISLKK